MSNIDYGPLTNLIGSWKGDKGEDVAPEADGPETNAYTETIVFSGAGDVDNAETQDLVSVHYQLIVHRLRDDKLIHNQTGFWIWDAAAQTVMHSFTIPRAVCVNAGGSYNGETDADSNVILNLHAGLGHPDWQIIQSPFMRDNASTREFRQQMTIGKEKLSYEQTTLVDIYGLLAFEHTDRNDLQRI